jgi:hypothetical protein
MFGLVRTYDPPLELPLVLRFAHPPLELVVFPAAPKVKKFAVLLLVNMSFTCCPAFANQFLTFDHHPTIVFYV